MALGHCCVVVDGAGCVGRPHVLYFSALGCPCAWWCDTRSGRGVAVGPACCCGCLRPARKLERADRTLLAGWAVNLSRCVNKPASRRQPPSSHLATCAMAHAHGLKLNAQSRLTPHTSRTTLSALRLTHSGPRAPSKAQSISLFPDPSNTLPNVKARKSVQCEDLKGQKKSGRETLGRDARDTE